MGLFGSKRNRTENRDFELFDLACAEASSDPQFLLRRNDLYPVFISPDFPRVFGVDPERLVDDVETLSRFVPDAERASLMRSLREWDGKAPLRMVCPYCPPNSPNTMKHFRVVISPVLDNTHLLVSLTDISGEKALVNQLETERNQAHRQMASRTDFMNQMSHEIRTPLNGIKGMIALAQDHKTEQERLEDDLSRATELSDYLLSLVNDALDMSRLENGRVELDLQPFDLRLVAARLQSMFEKQAHEKGIDFTVDAQDCETVFLMGDSLRLDQILVNFISNALKFTAKGGSVTVTFREMYRKDNRVSYLMRVRDTGKGMDPRFVSRIFRPFEQEDRTIARRYGGTGLGMAITSALVELMDGEIVVDTELGRGSDFTAYLPFAIAPKGSEEKLAAEGKTLETSSIAQKREAEYRFAGKRFLMAEDNEINAMIACEVLKSLGAEVDIANDGPVVVRMFEDAEPGTYDAVLMDIQMPTFNGWEAARRIRALDRRDARAIPIIALSANNYAEDARRSREAGMNGHAGKPLEISEIKAQLAAAEAESAYRGEEE